MKENKHFFEDANDYTCPRCGERTICLITYKRKKYCFNCWEKVYYSFSNKEVSPAPLPERHYRPMAI